MQRVTVMFVGAVSTVALAGPLTPPAGPIAPTPGPEPRIVINAVNTPGDADSLFRIAQPGSYYLAGNIVGEAGKSGIEIASSNVTLDLNGFDLAGVSGSLQGIVARASSPSHIVVKNGSVHDWDNYGVDLVAIGASNLRVSDIQSSGNNGRGVSIATGGIVERCVCGNNDSIGIGTQDGCLVIDCVTRANAASGILTGNGCTVRGCTSIVNSNYGIIVGSHCTVIDCTARSNVIDGINSSVGSTVSACTAALNAGNGFTLSNGGSITGCAARSNTTNGISVGDACLVLACDCSLNGDAGGNGAGIRVFGGDSRIEGNNCTGADRGIEVLGAGNVIIRNTCSGNTTNWTIVANNVVGPILDRTAPASAAISGNSAPSSLGTTEPNANFTY